MYQAAVDGSNFAPVGQSLISYYDMQLMILLPNDKLTIASEKSWF